MFPAERAADKPSGVNAGWRVLFAFQRPWPRATHRERSIKRNGSHGGTKARR
jgi:hypothetical protein